MKHLVFLSVVFLTLTARAETDGPAEDLREQSDPAVLSLSNGLESVLLHGELPELKELSDQRREALLDPERGYVSAYKAWLNYVRTYNRTLENDYDYRSPTVIRKAADNPVSAPRRLDTWTQRIVHGKPGIETAFAQTLRLMDELPALNDNPDKTGERKSQTETDRAGDFDAFVEALLGVAKHVDLQALGAIPAEERKLMSFVLPLLCRSSDRFVNQSQNAPTYFLNRNFYLSDTFSPGDKATSRSATPVPPEIYSLTGLGRYLRALAGRPLAPDMLLKEEEASENHPKFSGAVDFTAMRSAVAMLSTLLSPEGLDLVEGALADMPPLSKSVPGVRGDVLNMTETPYGPVIVGGAGPNRYTSSDYLAIIDLGGDNDYIFTETEKTLGEQPLQVIVDFAGDDVYAVDGVGGPGAGVLGINILIDRNGNDRYLQGLSSHFTAREHKRATLLLDDPEGEETKLVPYIMLYGNPDEPDESGVELDAGFAFGAGMLGAGLHIDEGEGEDLYLGQKYAFGAGFWAGVGVLHETGGNDVFATGAAAIGAGVNGALGLLDNRGGDDHYQCLGLFENGYSAGQEWDNGYEGNGIGYGSSWRVESRNQKTSSTTLGGGVGLVYDTAGSDSYVSSSFSLAAGYAGGLGMIVDKGGADTYFTNRGPGGSNHNGWSGNHALANGCHRGLGFLFDYDGDDRYSASALGGATAWDLGISCLIDLGGKDRMTDLHQGSNWRGDVGYGAAHSFAVSYNKGGADVYQRRSFANAGTLPKGYPGNGGNFSFFFDIGTEKDTYHRQDWNDTARLGRMAWNEDEDGKKYPLGLGLFIDKPRLLPPPNEP